MCACVCIYIYICVCVYTILYMYILYIYMYIYIIIMSVCVYIVVHTGIDSESPSAFLAPGRWSQGPPHPRTPARRESTPWHWEKMGGFWETGAVWDECPRLNWDCPTLGWKIFWKIFSNFSVWKMRPKKYVLGLKNADRFGSSLKWNRLPDSWRSLSNIRMICILCVYIYMLSIMYIWYMYVM